jgi:CRP/FNR family transcriptional regulator, cyclic AMP receptor protein
MGSSILEDVKAHPFSTGLTPEHCETLAAFGRRAHHQPEDILFAEGDEKHEFFLLLSGRVALETMAQGKPLRVQTLEGGEGLGWSALVVGRGKLFQARALEPVEALVFDGHALLERCRSDTCFGYKIMHRLLGIVSGRLSAARVQLLDMHSPIARRAGA